MKLLFFISAIITLVLISYYLKVKGNISRNSEDISTANYIWSTLKMVLMVSLVMLAVLTVLYGVVTLIRYLGL
ncbi:MAG: hypothetical protein HKN22_03255 [Bacteroidia bacterium]|nr:hypothetical protein [Bacteroidia bacterium]